MYYQATEVLSNKSGSTRVLRPERPGMAAEGVIILPLQQRFECGAFVDTLRRMVLDREGILDMLIKGRGSG